MELKSGYKQTEAGVIPDDWLHLSLGRVSKLQRGFDLPYRSRKKGEIPIITSSGFGEYHSEFRVQGPGVVTGRYGTIGEVFYIQENFWPLNTTLYVKDFCGNDPLYISYLLRRIDFHTHSGKSGVPGVNRNDLHEIVVALPPSNTEQKAIAEALSDADALIESLDQLIAKKRQIKQGTMQELLTGKRRLPGFSGELEIKSLGELFEITSSKRVFQSEWKLEGIPFYRARELAVLGETGNVENELFISKNMYDSFKSMHGVPEIGDMLVTGVGTLGKVYVVTGDHDFYFKDGNIIWFKIRGSVCTDFLKQLYLTPMVKKQIFDASAGTTVGTYTISSAKKTTISLPSLSEQTAIATILTDMDTELAALESRLAKARQIKQGMMRELLTGRIRLL